MGNPRFRSAIQRERERKEELAELLREAGRPSRLPMLLKYTGIALAVMSAFSAKNAVYDTLFKRIPKEKRPTSVAAAREKILEDMNKQFGDANNLMIGAGPARKMPELEDGVLPPPGPKGPQAQADLSDLGGDPLARGKIPQHLLEELGKHGKNSSPAPRPFPQDYVPPNAKQKQDLQDFANRIAQQSQPQGALNAGSYRPATQAEAVLIPNPPLRMASPRDPSKYLLVGSIPEAFQNEKREFPDHR